MIRCQTRIRALELGLIVAESLKNGTEQTDTSSFKGIKNLVKINDLPLNEAKRQIEVYRTELARIEKEHKNYAYM